MISPTHLQLLAAGVYAVAFLGLLAGVRFVSRDRRRYCYPLVGVVGFASLALVLEVFGIASVPVGESTLSIPNVVEGVVAYAVIWGTCGWLADVDHRMLAAVVGIPIVMVVCFQVAVVVSPEAALAAAAFIIVGYAVVTYLFVGPIWAAAQDLPEARRLLHWKCRNLLLFLTGVLILFATVSVAVSLTPFVSTVLTINIEMLLRIGVAGFLFANVSALEDGVDAERETADADGFQFGSAAD